MAPQTVSYMDVIEIGVVFIYWYVQFTGEMVVSWESMHRSDRMAELIAGMHWKRCDATVVSHGRTLIYNDFSAQAAKLHSFPIFLGHMCLIIFCFSNSTLIPDKELKPTHPYFYRTPSLKVILKGDLIGMPVAVKLPLANASLSLPDLANELLWTKEDEQTKAEFDTEGAVRQCEKQGHQREFGETEGQKGMNYSNNNIW